jgi:hypothetical protein
MASKGLRLAATVIVLARTEASTLAYLALPRIIVGYHVGCYVSLADTEAAVGACDYKVLFVKRFASTFSMLQTIIHRLLSL